MTKIEQLQKHLNNGEGVLIVSGANRLYFTGFKSSAGVLLITKNSADFLIDFRYFEKAEKTIQHCSVILATKTGEQLGDLAKSNGVNNVYVETSYLSMDELKRYEEIFADQTVSYDSHFDRLISQLRQIKDEEELKKIKLAQSITDDTFSHILKHLQVGKTEREIALEMEFYMRKQGSEGVSFDFIVVSGQNSSLPHGVPTNKKIATGDFITMDFGAVVDGYRSDMTRTVAVGTVTSKQRHVYKTVLEAQKTAFDAITPGAICKNVDRAARSYIDACGYAGRFGHGLGHSVGIEIHEAPCFNTSDQTVLTPGMILTVEPGIYLPGEFGVRIEDMVYITDQGYDNLTASNKDLIIL